MVEYYAAIPGYGGKGTISQGMVLCAGVLCHMVEYCAADMLGCGGLGMVRWGTVHCAGMPGYGGLGMVRYDMVG